MKDNAQNLNRNFVRSLNYVSTITIPIGLGIALTAEPFVMTFFTDKWVEAIPVIRGIAIYALLLSLFRNAGSFYKAQGKPEVLTYLTIARLIILLPVLWIALMRTQSITAVAWVQAGVALVSGVMSLAVAARMFQIKVKDILVQYQPGILSGLAMSAAVLGVLALLRQVPAMARLLAAVVSGVMVYGGALWLQGPERMRDTLGKIISALRGG
jgi:Membrane protein involved in the export of O-antigen and teichoic acid